MIPRFFSFSNRAGWPPGQGDVFPSADYGERLTELAEFASAGAWLREYGTLAELLDALGRETAGAVQSDDGLVRRALTRQVHELMPGATTIGVDEWTFIWAPR
jgi:hypothetical protein